MAAYGKTPHIDLVLNVMAPTVRSIATACLRCMLGLLADDM
jgi:hypothetical protein